MAETTQTETLVSELVSDAFNAGEAAKSDIHAKAKEAIERYRISKDSGVIRPTVVLNCGGKMIFTEGAVSLVSGMPKGRKTFFVTSLAAAYICGEYYSFSRPDKRPPARPLVHIDTEQANYKVYDVYDRVRRIAGEGMTDEDFDNRYYAFSMASVQGEEIRRYVVSLLDYLSPALVIVDVGTDLITDTNDNQESKELFQWFLKQAKDYDTHICVVAHTNPNDPNGKTRGHFGSEGERKCELVLVVENKGDYSKVWPRMARNEQPAEQWFYIDVDGLPKFLDTPPDQPDAKELAEIDELKALFTTVFGGDPFLRHGEMVRRIMGHIGCSDKTAKRRISNATKYGLISNRENGDYTLCEHDENDDEKYPF